MVVKRINSEGKWVIKILSFLFQVPVPNDTELQELLIRNEFLHVSFQRKYGIKYRHHAVLILNENNGQERKKISQYDVGSGEFKVFSSFQRTEKEITDISNFDFEKGVHLCVYGKQGTKINYQDVKERAEERVKCYLLPFWSPMSSNCEHFATNIMTGHGSSRQVEQIGVFMRLLGDGLDPLSFFEQFFYIVLFKVVESLVPGTRWAYISLIPEINFLFNLYKREERMLNWQLKTKRDRNRNMFKYVLSFLFRWTTVFTLSSSYVVKILATLIVPIVLGFVFDLIFV